MHKPTYNVKKTVEYGTLNIGITTTTTTTTTTTIIIIMKETLV